MKRRIGKIKTTPEFLNTPGWDLIKLKGFNIISKEEIKESSGEIIRIDFTGIWDRFDILDDAREIPTYKIIFRKEIESEPYIDKVIKYE